MNRVAFVAVASILTQRKV